MLTAKTQKILEDAKNVSGKEAFAMNRLFISDTPVLGLVGLAGGVASLTGAVLVGAFIQGKLRADQEFGEPNNPDAADQADSREFSGELRDWLQREAARIEQAAYEVTRAAHTEPDLQLSGEQIKRIYTGK